MKTIICSIGIVITFTIQIFAQGNYFEKKLIGAWVGSGATFEFNGGNSGLIKTSLCTFNIKWSATQDKLTINYLSTPDCSYSDVQGKFSGNPKKPKDDTVKYTLKETSLKGVPARGLTIFSRTAPRGITYYQAIIQEQNISRSECKKRIAQEQSKCDSSSPNSAEAMLCKNKVILKYLDCM